MKFMKTLAGLTLAYLVLGAAPSMAQASSSAPTPLSNTSIELCKNRPFALCAASTCTPTGKQIAVNTPDGGTRFFPEADCTCPVLPEGDTGAIANLRGGNMKGSCNSEPGTVWSLYQTTSNFPQEPYGWNYHKAGANLTCKADLNLGQKYANCFSFKLRQYSHDHEPGRHEGDGGDLPLSARGRRLLCAPH